MNFKSKVCKDWFVLYSEAQIGFRTVGRVLVLPIRCSKLLTNLSR